MRGWSLLLVASAMLMSAVRLRAADPQAGKIDFNRDVRPILAENCLSCHGPDGGHRKADLRLDVRSESDKGTAIVPCRPEASLVIQRILAEKVEERMPPAETKKSLTNRQKEILTQWIAEGAVYQKHWAFEPPQKATPPEIAGVDHPVDRFLQARLAAADCAPSPPASPETLLRRVSLDLIGLPPSIAEIDEFLAASEHDPHAAYRA